MLNRWMPAAALALIAVAPLPSLAGYVDSKAVFQAGNTGLSTDAFETAEPILEFLGAAPIRNGVTYSMISPTNTPPSAQDIAIVTPGFLPGLPSDALIANEFGSTLKIALPHGTRGVGLNFGSGGGPGGDIEIEAFAKGTLLDTRTVTNPLLGAGTFAGYYAFDSDVTELRLRSQSARFPLIDDLMWTRQGGSSTFTDDQAAFVAAHTGFFTDPFETDEPFFEFLGSTVTRTGVTYSKISPTNTPPTPQDIAITTPGFLPGLASDALLANEFGATLDIALPGGVKAVGFNVASGGGRDGNVEIYVYSNQKMLAYRGIASPSLLFDTFLGFHNFADDITRIRIVSQVERFALIDNFMYTLRSGAPDAVPEPPALALLAAGLVGLGVVRRRAKR